MTAGLVCLFAALVLLRVTAVGLITNISIIKEVLYYRNIGYDDGD